MAAAKRETGNSARPHLGQFILSQQPTQPKNTKQNRPDYLLWNREK
jgi:hypothetical protein